MGIFHRYSSTIHGNYRQAYLRCGLLTGALLAAYLLVRCLMGSPVGSPLSYVSDAVLLVCIFLFSAYYRNSLPDKLVTLKELMLRHRPLGPCRCALRHRPLGHWTSAPRADSRLHHHDDRQPHNHPRPPAQLLGRMVGHIRCHGSAAPWSLRLVPSGDIIQNRKR